MKEIEKWMESIFENALPKEIVAIAFNLYDDGDNQWSIEMVGSSSFDPEDSDWACDEVFDTRDKPYSWEQDAEWEEVLQEAADCIKNYIETGKYSEQLKAYKGIGVGFVDGDINIVYQR